MHTLTEDLRTDEEKVDEFSRGRQMDMDVTAQSKETFRTIHPSQPRTP